MYQTFRSAVEDAAQKNDPATADLFLEGKQVHGLLNPIEEAAVRRASTTNQSPAGGLLDVGAAGFGHASGIPGAGLVAPIARRVISPRIASSVAVGSDGLANMLMQSPQLQSLSQTNPVAFQSLAGRISSQMADKGSRAASYQSPVSEPRLEAHYDPSEHKTAPIEEAKDKFLEGN